MWKQKGEEYRVTGYGGWSFISKTYVPRFSPKLPGNTNANYRKELEGVVQILYLKKISQHLFDFKIYSNFPSHQNDIVKYLPLI